MVKKQGVWYLTPEGKKALSLGPVALLRAATTAYRKWKDENQPLEAKEDQDVSGNGQQAQEAKLEEPLSFEEAQDLIEQSRLDERLGLLTWALGKMGLWDAIVLIADHVAEWQMERIQQLRMRYDVTQRVASE